MSKEILFRRSAEALLVWILGVTFVGPCSGQQLGHYLQGATGLGAGSMAPPGFYASYLGYFYPVSSIKGPSGNGVNASLNVWAHAANLTYVIPTAGRSFDFSMGILLPWMSNRIQANVIPTDKRITGYSDTYVTPFNFGWHKSRASFLVNYTFVAPTGSFDANSPINAGLGFWSHILQASTTVNMGKTKMWNATLTGSGEMAGKKKGIDVTVGPSLTLEYGLGRHFKKGLMNVGASGHYYQKLSPDSGSAIGPAILGLKDRAFGLGPEFQYIFLKPKLAFTARYQPQFGVRNRVRGDIFLITLTYLHAIKP